MFDEKTKLAGPDTAQSTGPRSEVGKRNSSKDTIKSGLYSPDLMVNPEDQHEFETLQEELRLQFKPATAMQQISFDQIVCFCWLCKLALRLETRAIGPALGANPKNSEEGKAEQGVPLNQWVGTSNETLRKGIRFLEDLRADVADCGLIHLEQDGPCKDSVIKGFGQPFYDSLVQWKGFNVCAIRLENHLDEHRRMFPPTPSAPEDCSRYPRVAPDARLKWDMVVKLIDLHTQHLRELLATNGSRHPTNGRSEIRLRLFDTASRDLRRAVDWHLYLKDLKL